MCWGKQQWSKAVTWALSSVSRDWRMGLCMCGGFVGLGGEGAGQGAWVPCRAHSPLLQGSSPPAAAVAMGCSGPTVARAPSGTAQSGPNCFRAGANVLPVTGQAWFGSALCGAMQLQAAPVPLRLLPRAQPHLWGPCVVPGQVLPPENQPGNIAHGVHGGRTQPGAIHGPHEQC